MRPTNFTNLRPAKKVLYCWVPKVTPIFMKIGIQAFFCMQNKKKEN